jgi:uncharacterized membrane protein
MRTWLENRWDLLRTNFWFVPGTMAVLAGAACIALILLDTHLSVEFEGTLRWLRMGGTPGLRTFLATLTGSIVTVLALVFSITTVVLTLAASQLGPRLLRNFMRDRSNQVVLGVFVSTFVYTLIALLALGRLEAAGTAPHITTFGAFLLALGSVVVLVYFIHHVAESIQAPNVIHAVASELEAVIRRNYPSEGAGRTPEKSARDSELPPEVAQVVVAASSYVQAIDERRLLAAAGDGGVVARTLHRPGDFVVKGDPLIAVHGDSPPGQETVERLREAFILGNCRTATQDVEFVLMQLVEIAMRALSPGLNDPLTAITCVDRIGSALALLAGRHMPPPERYDEQGALRAVLDTTSFGGICRAAFEQIRQHARSNAAVTIRLLETIEVVGRHVHGEEQKAALRRQAFMVHRAGQALPEPLDCEAVDDRYARVTAVLAPSGTETPSEGNAAGRTAL